MRVIPPLGSLVVKNGFVHRLPVVVGGVHDCVRIGVPPVHPDGEEERTVRVPVNKKLVIGEYSVPVIGVTDGVVSLEVFDTKKYG